LAVAAGVALGFIVGCIMLFAVMTNTKHTYVLAYAQYVKQSLSRKMHVNKLRPPALVSG